MSFLWDILKAKSNYQKHKVSFEEAQSVFLDTLAVTFDDFVHSEQERREIINWTLKSRQTAICLLFGIQGNRALNQRTSSDTPGAQKL